MSMIISQFASSALTCGGAAASRKSHAEAHQWKTFFFIHYAFYPISEHIIQDKLFYS